MIACVTMPQPPLGWTPHVNVPPAPAPPTSSGHPRRRRWLIITLTTVGAVLIVATAGIIGRITAPSPDTSSTVGAPATSTATPAAPSVRPFAAADETWCKTYQVTTHRLAEAGRAVGAPRRMEAPDLPATSWTADETTANRRFAEYMATWITGLSHLRETAKHPDLKSLIETSFIEQKALVETIRSGTYVPSDFIHYRSDLAVDRGLIAICKELVG